MATTNLILINVLVFRAEDAPTKDNFFICIPKEAFLLAFT